MKSIVSSNNRGWDLYVKGIVLVTQNLLLNMSAAHGEERVCFRSVSSTRRIAIARLFPAKKMSLGSGCQ